MESYVRIEGRGFKNLTYPYTGVGEGQKLQNHPYVTNEWPLRFRDLSLELASESQFCEGAEPLA